MDPTVVSDRVDTTEDRQFWMQLTAGGSAPVR
jgi:hypothetical protein